MLKTAWLGLWVGVVLSVVSPAVAQATEFAVVGPRALGMGGTGVAVTSDALAAYWNPAGLALSQKVGFQAQALTHLVDRLGVGQLLEDIQALELSPTTLEEANTTVATLGGLIEQINAPGASISAIGTGGVYFKGRYGEHAYGLSISDVATAGLFVPTPLSVTQAGTTLTLNGQLAAEGLEARQVGLSLAYAMQDRTYVLGTTLKLMQGVVYSASLSPSTTEGDFDFVSDLDEEDTRTSVGLDLGAIYRPASWLQLGMVWKEINRPSFDTPSGRTVELDPQIRGGIAFNPWETMTLTADADFTSNDTRVPGVQSRMVGIGAEQTLLSQLLSLRVGAMKNMEDDDSKVTATAGLGLRLWALNVEVGAGYDFEERQALLSTALSLLF
jgi:hypothetical protein